MMSRYGGRKLWLTEFAVAKEHDEVSFAYFHVLIWSWFAPRVLLIFDNCCRKVNKQNSYSLFAISLTLFLFCICYRWSLMWPVALHPISLFYPQKLFTFISLFKRISSFDKSDFQEKIVDFIHQLIPMLEKADFIWRYSWFYTRYYPVIVKYLNFYTRYYPVIVKYIYTKYYRSGIT